MRAIMEADFFATDLKLYLNTHPDDERALEMYREACKQYKACKAAFEDSFYPLTCCSAGKKGCWDWPDGNWPPASV
ncbi:MAG: spore coat protein CotJB [Ruminococcaceae bacterium]|nr:spore coat protein CotJB [Oscillospiraceae bacterium]